MPHSVRPTLSGPAVRNPLPFLTRRVRSFARGATRSRHGARPLHRLMIAVCLLAGMVMATQSRANGTGGTGPGGSAANGRIPSLGLSKSATVDTVQSGVTFTFTINYSVSSTNDDGQNVVITDVLPPQLLLTSGNVTLIGNPQTASTNYNAGTGTATFTMVNPLPAGSSGSVQINVMFPPGTTPDLTTACNSATITASNAATVTSNVVCVVARAVHRFTFVKEHYAGNALGGTVVYRLRVINPSGNSIGGLNLNGATIEDNLPAGAVFVSATGSPTVTGSLITWSLGNLVVSPWYNPTFVDIFLTVQYPSPPFTQNQVVCNTACLKGTPVGASPIQLCDTACVTLLQPVPGVQMLKGPWYSPMTNRVPGCTGFYTLSPSNTGNVPVDSFKVTDVLPTQVQLNSFWTGSYVNFPANSITVRYRTTANAAWTTAGPYTAGQTISVYGSPSSTNLGLSPGTYITQIQFDYGTVNVGFGTNAPVYLYFTLLANDFVTSAPVAAGDTITNCATLTWRYLGNPGTPITHCKVFVVDTLKPVLSLSKWTQSTGPYFPGDTIRFLLRFYNIGTASLTGVTVTDVLPTGLQYLGNITYAGGGGAPSPATLGPSVTVVGQTVTWTFTQPFPTAGCGTSTQYYYDIEFDVLVTNGTPPGQVCNTYSVSGSNHPTVGSNQACNTINSVPTVSSQKKVRGSLDTSFTLAGTTVAGGAADYELTVTNTGNVTIKDIVIVDILPFVGDVGVINWTTSRGSQFQVNLIGSITAPPGTNVYYSVDPNPCRTDLTLSGPPGCVATTWYTWAGLLANSYTAVNVRSVKLDFGAQTLAPGQSFTVSWPMTVPLGASVNDIACNSFGYVAKRADNNAIIGPAEPLKVCITIKPPVGASVGNRVWLDANQDGVQDASETGLNGVQVELWRLGPDATPYTPDDTVAVNLFGTAIPFVMTANNVNSEPGYYQFSNLPAGQYYVRFQVPGGFGVSPQNVGSALTDSDPVPSGPNTGATAPFPLAANAVDTTIDMGLYYREQVPCDEFRADVKPQQGGKCCWDLTFAMVSPTAFVTLTATTPTVITSMVPPTGWTSAPLGGVYPTAGVVLTPTGSSSGMQTATYCISPGNVQPQQLILTWHDQSGAVICADTLRTDCPKDSLGTGPGGVKFHDLNGNGTHDAAEPGIADWLIRLVPVAGGRSLETRTDAQGRYQFRDVPAGTYYVTEERRFGWMQTTPVEVLHTAIIAPGTTLPPYDFGNTTPPCDEPTDTVRLVAGTVDQFNGPEPSSPSPALLAWNTANYGLPTVGFDGLTKDEKGAFFGHTFSGFAKPGCWLMGAKLRIRIRATGWSSPNDGIGIVVGSTLAWYQNISNLTITNTWNPGQFATLILNLDSLPPGIAMNTTVLAALASGTFNIFVQNHTDVDYIGLELYICCPEEKGKAVLQGCKWNDLDGDGVWDAGEPGIPNWTINLSNGQSVTTGQDGCYSVTVPAPATYVVSENVVTPWIQTFPPGPGTHTVTVTPRDTVRNLNFGNILRDPGGTGQVSCDSLIGGQLDTACCQYSATIQNNVGSPITSISWSLSGGTMSSFTTAPCAPVAPVTPGSTSGILTYVPGCAGNLQFIIDATPTTSSGWITVTLVVHHGEKDSCRLTFRFRCERAPVTACDSVNVKPFLFTGLDLSGRSFTVYNVKVPASPIVSIDISGTPPPCFLQGGALKVDGVSTAWSVPYTRIPITGTINALSQVKFNLGVDYTCGWTGTIRLAIHHADGDSCVYVYGPWAATPPPGGGVVINASTVAKRLYAARLRVRNTSGQRPVKWIAVEMLSREDRVFAGSGASWDGTTREIGEEPLDEHQQGRTEALFGLQTPLRPGQESEGINLVVARDSARSGLPVIRWTAYDVDGNAMTTDTLVIGSPVLSIRGDAPPSASARGFELLPAFPNPAANSATVSYMLASPMSIVLELYDATGARVSTIDAGTRGSGMHGSRVDFGTLPAGRYWLRLTTPDGVVSRPLVITR